MHGKTTLDSIHVYPARSRAGEILAPSRFDTALGFYQENCTTGGYASGQARTRTCRNLWHACGTGQGDLLFARNLVCDTLSKQPSAAPTLGLC